MIKKKKDNQYTSMPVKTRHEEMPDEDIAKPRSNSLFAGFLGQWPIMSARRKSSPAEIPEGPPGGDFVGAQITEEAMKAIQQFGKKS